MHEMTQSPPMQHPQPAPHAHGQGDVAPTTDTATKTKLSIVIPVYNEFATILTLIDMVVKAPLPEGVTREIICVNDCSTDSTEKKLDQLPHLHPEVEFKIFHKPKNEGKGAALRDGFKHATGDLVIVQDADLEYDPADYLKLLQPIVDDKADVVYG